MLKEEYGASCWNILQFRVPHEFTRFLKWSLEASKALSVKELPDALPVPQEALWVRKGLWSQVAIL